MSDDFEKFQQITAELRDIEERISRRQGRLDALNVELNRKYKCKTIAQAKKKRASLIKQIKQLQDEIDGQIKNFIDAFSDRFGEV